MVGRVFQVTTVMKEIYWDEWGAAFNRTSRQFTSIGPSALPRALILLRGRYWKFHARGTWKLELVSPRFIFSRQVIGTNGNLLFDERNKVCRGPTRLFGLRIIQWCYPLCASATRKSNMYEERWAWSSSFFYCYVISCYAQRYLKLKTSESLFASDKCLVSWFIYFWGRILVFYLLLLEII